MMNICFPFSWKVRAALVCACCGMAALTGCKDADYDFDEVDLTVGLGSDSVALPSLDTRQLQIGDLFEIEEGNCVKILTDGSYAFLQEGDPVAPVHPRIAPIHIAKQQFTTSDVVLPSFSVPSGSTATAPLDVTQDIATFDYSADKPDEVVSLSRLTVNQQMTLRLHFPQAVRTYVPTVDEITFLLPSCLEVSDVSSNARLNGHSITLSNVSTASGSVSVTVQVSALTMASDNLGSLTMANGKISLTGRVQAHISSQLTLTADAAQALGGQRVTSEGELSYFDVTSATGRFNPSIELNDVGDTEIDDLPDFLDDGRVVLDLYNPMILLTLTNDMPLGGTITGQLTSYKDGQTLGTVSLDASDPIRIGANGTTRVCISRQPVEGYDQNIVKDDLCDLIRTIPDRINFSTQAQADSETEATFVFGQEYTVQPSYEVSAPLQFAREAMVVYTDSMDGINGDLEDYDLSADACLLATATIENCAPVFLHVSVTPYDSDHRDIPASDIAVEVSTDEQPVAASPDGTAVSSPLTVRISQTEAGAQRGAIKSVEGLRLHIICSATNPADASDYVEGVTLNARTQYVRINDVNLKLVGKVIADFNDDDDDDE